MISVQNSLFEIMNTVLLMLVVVVVAAAATMISNKISLHVSWDREQLHLQHFLLEHKSSSF
jgi:hypothetical protein